MYERFTDPARTVMQLANQEAQRFNHEYIGTEHLLLGLVKLGSGTAHSVIAHFKIDLRQIRLEVEKIVQSGLELVTMGKLPQTPRAKKVIEYAMEEARALNHNYIGTEHLLLGLLRENEGVAAQVLMNLGITNLEVLREEVIWVVYAAGIGDSYAPNSPFQNFFAYADIFSDGNNDSVECFQVLTHASNALIEFIEPPPQPNTDGKETPPVDSDVNQVVTTFTAKT